MEWLGLEKTLKIESRHSLTLPRLLPKLVPQHLSETPPGMEIQPGQPVPAVENPCSEGVSSGVQPELPWCMEPEAISSPYHSSPDRRLPAPCSSLLSAAGQKLRLCLAISRRKDPNFSPLQQGAQGTPFCGLLSPLPRCVWVRAAVWPRSPLPQPSLLLLQGSLMPAPR